MKQSWAAWVGTNKCNVFKQKQKKNQKQFGRAIFT